MNKETNNIIPEIRFPEFVNGKEWEIKELIELGDLINGLTYNPDDTRDKGLLVLRSSNIQDGVIDLNDCVYVRTDIKGANLSAPNDILVCVRNGSKDLIGKNAIIPQGIQLATHGAFMTVFRAKDPEFVFQLFQTNFYHTQVKADLGATINSINGKNFLKYEFPVPTIPYEQQKIAYCLSSLDEVITAHNQKLELLKDHKKGLMQNLFPQEGEKVPKFRFPEFKNDGEWVEKELNDLCFNISSGKDKTFEGGDFELYGSTGIIGRTEYPSYKGEYILVARVGANAGFLNRAKGKFGVTDNTLIIDLKIVDVIDFIFFTLETTGLNKLVFGSGQPLITGGQLKSLNLLIPMSEKEQKKIASCLSSLDALISALAEKIEQLKLHKKGLMQGLFPKINE